MSKIIVIGDIMLDHYIKGNVERISPEAPVAVLHAQYDSYCLGGAANTANNLATLGISPYLIGLVNGDEAGKKIEKLCKQNRITTIFYSDNRPTIIKQRIIALGYNQQLLRIDREETHHLDDKLCKEIKDKIINIHPDYIIISDYAKGMITPSLVEELKKRFSNKLIIDTKPEHIDYFYGCFLVKPNLSELSKMYGSTLENKDKDVIDASLNLINRYNLEYIITTRAEKGATIVGKDGLIKHARTHVEEVHDVTGAGDTFLATLTYFLEKEKDIIHAMKMAIKAASITITKIGTSSVTLEEIETYPYNVKVI